MTLRTDYEDSTTSATTHAAAHNDTNTAVNALDERYRTLAWQSPRALASDITGAGVYVVSTGRIQSQSTSGVNGLMFYFDTDEWAIAGRTTKLRIVVTGMVNDVATGATLTFGLYPVGTPSGGIGVTNPNFGAVVSGSTVSPGTLAANSIVGPADSGDFTMPTSGLYGLGCNVSGAMTASSQAVVSLLFQIRHV